VPHALPDYPWNFTKVTVSMVAVTAGQYKSFTHMLSYSRNSLDCGPVNSKVVQGLRDRFSQCHPAIRPSIDSFIKAARHDLGFDDKPRP
jgi:hypothetical protein